MAIFRKPGFKINLSGDVKRQGADSFVKMVFFKCKCLMFEVVCRLDGGRIKMKQGFKSMNLCFCTHTQKRSFCHKEDTVGTTVDGLIKE